MSSQPRTLTPGERRQIWAHVLELDAALRHPDELVGARVQAGVIRRLADDLRAANEPLGAAAIATIARVLLVHVERYTAPASALRADGGPSELTVDRWLSSFDR